MDRGAVVSEETDVPRLWLPGHPALRDKAGAVDWVLHLEQPSAVSLTRPPRQGPPGHHPFSHVSAHNPPTFRGPILMMPVPTCAFRAQVRLQSCRGQRDRPPGTCHGGHVDPLWTLVCFQIERPARPLRGGQPVTLVLPGKHQLLIQSVIDSLQEDLWSVVSVAGPEFSVEVSEVNET